MFCTTTSGFPGICLPKNRVTKRPQSSIEPPTEFPTTILIDLPLKKSCAPARGVPKKIPKPTRRTAHKPNLFIKNLRTIFGEGLGVRRQGLTPYPSPFTPHEPVVNASRHEYANRHFHCSHRTTSRAARSSRC